MLKRRLSTLISRSLVLLPLVACNSVRETPAGKADASLEQPASKAVLRKTNLSAEDRKAWRQTLRWPESCEERFDYIDENWGGLEFYELAPNQYLVEVTCTRGAYQGFQVYLYFDETKSPPVSKLLTFKTYESKDEQSLDEKQATELWGTPEFNAKTKELMILNRFRGIGDCGSLATYSFQKGGPELREFRAKVACDGKGVEDPKSWKKIAQL